MYGERPILQKRRRLIYYNIFLPPKHLTYTGNRAPRIQDLPWEVRHVCSLVRPQYAHFTLIRASRLMYSYLV